MFNNRNPENLNTETFGKDKEGDLLINEWGIHKR